MPRPVQGLHHALELAHLLAALAGGGVGRVGGEEADRRVAPVVREAALEQERLVDDVVDGQQLDRGHPEVAQVVQGRLRGETRVGAAQVVAHLRVQHREALDVRLVDHRLVQRRVRPAVALPVEARVDHHRLGHGVDVVLVVALEVGVLVVGRHVGQHVGRVPLHGAVDRLRVRVEQQLGRVEAGAGLGVVGAVDAEAVALARADAGQEAVPRMRGALGEVDPLLGFVAVEQAQLHPLGVLGEDREVRPLPVPRRAEREGAAGPDLGHRTSAPASGGSTTWPGSTVAWWVASSSSTARSTGTCTGLREKLASTRCSPRRTFSQPWCSS